MKRYLLAFAALTVANTAPLSANHDACCHHMDMAAYDQTHFDGFYIGANVGAISHVPYRNDFDGFLTDNSSWTVMDTNVEVGLQLGYDIQCRNQVIGLVTDWNWTNVDHVAKDNPNGGGSDNTIKNELEWFGTIRTRAGLAISETLVYVTAGAAVARFDTTWSDSGTAFFPDQRTRWGWVGGVGTELNMWCGLSMGMELLGMHFDDETRTFVASGPTSFSFGQSDSIWVGRFNLNYRFGDLFSCF